MAAAAATTPVVFIFDESNGRYEEIYDIKNWEIR